LCIPFHLPGIWFKYEFIEHRYPALKRIIT
jgi:hypothetical protein